MLARLESVVYNIIHKEEENMAKASGNYSIVLLIILLILAIIPGLIYLILHPISKLGTLIILLILGIIPGILYLVWPSGGYKG
jgi:predicted membrane metal-binding protein